MVDQKLSFSKLINLIARIGYCLLCRLQVVLCSLSHNAALFLKLVTAELITSLPNRVLGLLDRVLHSGLSDLCFTFQYASVSAYMCDVLNWLPASLCISYRIAALPW